ncbi:MAG TPA: SIS domain-containing protein [Vicinamibacterales bacterium]|nr:SIS domain-containing protein [Vicinamibacterales bacterium]
MSEARIRAVFETTASLHRDAIAHCGAGILQAAALVGEALGAGRKVLIFGNGGSAADSQHFAAELVGRFQMERRALAALALTTDSSILTSIANDYAYDQVFVRQIQALGAPGDIAFGITTSGRSGNVLTAFEEARRRSLKTIALVGADAASVANLADLVITTPTPQTARIQELHRTVIHCICEIVESEAQQSA